MEVEILNVSDDITMEYICECGNEIKAEPINDGFIPTLRFPYNCPNCGRCFDRGYKSPRRKRKCL